MYRLKEMIIFFAIRDLNLMKFQESNGSNEHFFFFLFLINIKIFFFNLHKFYIVKIRYNELIT